MSGLACLQCGILGHASKSCWIGRQGFSSSAFCGNKPHMLWRMYYDGCEDLESLETAEARANRKQHGWRTGAYIGFTYPNAQFW
jgi:hypothetical protein